MTILQFDLLNNARDSLTHAVHLLAWDDRPPSNRYKQAILSVFHCAELLLKERLRRINPALMWENIDQYPSRSARTVGVDKAVTRLLAIGNVEIAAKDRETLVACRNLRNAIQHHEFEITEKEAKILLGKLLSFVFSFSSAQLSADLDQEFREDDTWIMLVEQFYEFANQHGPRISELMIKMGGPVGSCSHCGQDTVDLIFEKCSLCGQAYECGADEESYTWLRT
jgi:hypothetical protein